MTFQHWRSAKEHCPALAAWEHRERKRLSEECYKVIHTLQQTFPRCTAESRHKNTKTLLFKAEFQEPKSHSLLYKCPPACRHTIKNRLVQSHSSWFYLCHINIPQVTWHLQYMAFLGDGGLLNTYFTTYLSWQHFQKSYSQTVMMGNGHVFQLEFCQWGRSEKDLFVSNSEDFSN